MAIATVALFAALGGSVYAATRIDGHKLKVKSLPGNPLVPRSLPANRLRPGTIPGAGWRRLDHRLPGRRRDPGPGAGGDPARSADAARRADSALVAVSADEARRLNGHSAACAAGSREFAGACWETAFSAAACPPPVPAAAASPAAAARLPSPARPRRLRRSPASRWRRKASGRTTSSAHADPTSLQFGHPTRPLGNCREARRQSRPVPLRGPAPPLTPHPWSWLGVLGAHKEPTSGYPASRRRR